MQLLVLSELTHSNVCAQNKSRERVKTMHDNPLQLDESCKAEMVYTRTLTNRLPKQAPY
jgi:hypothetical protein